jgi:uncharacterized small protein (DUF1192 family)
LEDTIENAQDRKKLQEQMDYSSTQITALDERIGKVYDEINKLDGARLQKEQ